MARKKALEGGPRIHFNRKSKGNCIQDFQQVYKILEEDITRKIQMLHLVKKFSCVITHISLIGIYILTS